MKAGVSFLRFHPLDHKGVTGKWSVDSANGSPLGEIRWWSAWRRYVFVPAAGTLYDVSCMSEISDFIMRQMRARQ